MAQLIALEVSISLHQQLLKAKLPAYLANQILRASSSVALNLSEGLGKPTGRDRKRFYNIAHASARELKTALVLDAINSLSGGPALCNKSDRLCALTYKLWVSEK